MADYFDLWKLLAGLGLFLFAMNLMEDALRQLAGHRFRYYLRNTTSSTVRSALTGVVATAIVQSSSLVGLIVLALVGAGVIPLTNAIGIVLGSNLGTTFTGWIVAIAGFKLDLTALIFPLIAVGSLSYAVFKNQARAISQVLLSLALLLMGLDFMKESVELLTRLIDVNVLRDFPLIVYLIIGLVFTAIIQSSSATMMLTLSALYADIIPLPAAAAIVIGADMGTTSTVLLGSIQGAVAKRQLAMAHVLFNLSVDVLAFILLYPILGILQFLKLEDPLFTLVAFHNLFNLMGLVIFLPFIGQYAKLLQWLIKEDPAYVQHYIQNVPHDESELATEALSREVRRLIRLVILFTVDVMGSRIEHDASEAEIDIVALPSEDRFENYISLKKLEGEIVNYALKIPVSDNERLTARINQLISAGRSAVYAAKAVKDIAEDLEAFRYSDDHQYRQLFVQLNESNLSIFRDTYRLISHDENGIIDDDEINALRDRSTKIYDEFYTAFYEKSGHYRFDTADTSSLLNVHKELHTSQKALLKSIARLKISAAMETEDTTLLTTG